MIIWFTGLSGSGKSTLAQALAQRWQDAGRRVESLDGDVVRKLLPGRGFDAASRERHIEYMGFAAARLEAHGIDVIAAFISPSRPTRDFVRGLARQFVEVHVATPLDICEQRDVKGLYRAARAGKIADFTGISAPYEAPLTPEIRLDTSHASLSESLADLERQLAPFEATRP